MSYTMYIYMLQYILTSSIEFTTVISFHLLIKASGCWTPDFLINQQQSDLTVQDQYSCVVKRLYASLMMGREDSGHCQRRYELLSLPTVGNTSLLICYIATLVPRLLPMLKNGEGAWLRG